MPTTMYVSTAASGLMKIKQAAFAREYGASELMLATMTGCYPPPHDEMDRFARRDT